MLARMFRAHGEFCASRPWEVIIGTVTLTVSLISMSLFAVKNKVCGWNYRCDPDNLDEVLSSDLLILTITRCLAIMYIYLQFRNLRKMGSKYLLGIAGVFTIFSSFVFSITVINLVGSDLTGLNEALPFFLLLVDLAKAATLARFALSSSKQEEVVENIGRGMAMIGPTITLDAMVETLVIGVGTLSGVHRLETMCCFGCLSVVAHYLAFMTFYPACLALVLELSQGRNHGHPYLQLKNLAKALQEEEEQKPNPVTQRIKIIMSAGLVFVHAHSRWLTDPADQETGLGGAIDQAVPFGPGSLLEGQLLAPEEPLWMFLLKKATSIDYTLTIFLGIILSVKYTMFDSDLEMEEMAIEDQRNRSSSSRDIPQRELMSEDEAAKSKSSSCIVAKAEIVPNTNQVIPEVRSRTPKASFSIGDDSSDESECGENIPVVKETVTAATQTETIKTDVPQGPTRTVEECVKILKSDVGSASLTDEEIIQLVRTKHIPAYKLEGVIGDHVRGVSIRRDIVSAGLPDQNALRNLPYDSYDYSYVDGSCCENVIGYMPVPVGVAGPLLLDGDKFMVPMATTEGCLVASTNRGCRALVVSGGVRSTVISNGMTRAPVVRFPSVVMASKAKLWLEEPDHFDKVAEIFDSTSRFARLKKLQVVQAARNLYIRFVAITGDAMGMNMLSKGSEKALNMLQEDHFPDMEILSLSGNFCTDKKPSAINWIEGRGKSVVCEAVIPSHVIKNVLKTSASSLVDLNISKNLMGSAMAGSIGGFNAHASNIVTAIYIATGQDPAQNVCSSNCMTVMEVTGADNEDLFISCTMPSIEVGTVGGGTVLPPQAACLQMLGVRGASENTPGQNACTLARVISGTVLAAELSLMSALAAGHLVRSHLKHNRSVINMAATNAAAPLDRSSASGLTRQTPTSPPGTCIQKAP